MLGYVKGIAIGLFAFTIGGPMLVFVGAAIWFMWRVALNILFGWPLP